MMALGISTITNLLPQFVIASLLSLYYFSWASDVKYHVLMEPSFIMSSDPPGIPSFGHEVEFTPLHQQKFIEDSVVKQMTLALNSVALWMVIVLATSRTETVWLFVGPVPKIVSDIVFPFLAALFSVALFTSVIDRIGDEKTRRMEAVIVAGAISVLAFLLPTVSWLTRLRLVFTLLVMYFAALGVVAMSYFFQWKAKRGMVLKTRFLTSIASYSILVSLFAYSLISHAL